MPNLFVRLTPNKPKYYFCNDLEFADIYDVFIFYIKISNFLVIPVLKVDSAICNGCLEICAFNEKILTNFSLRKKKSHIKIFISH